MTNSSDQIALFDAVDHTHEVFDANPQRWPVADDWSELVNDFFASSAGVALVATLRTQLGEGAEIYPAQPLRALLLTPQRSVKVVILGQDPYPTAGHADGLAFSAARGRPKSLARICEVLTSDRPGWSRPTHSNLDVWAQQGALLINTALSVRRGEAGSHLDVGWHSLTTQILQSLASPGLGVKFMLWGGKAQAFAEAAFEALPQTSRPSSAQILRSRHPSYDFQKQFMLGESHFEHTADIIDWWRWGVAAKLPK